MSRDTAARWPFATGVKKRFRKAGPTDQKRLGQVSQSVMEEVPNPPVALSRTWEIGGLGYADFGVRLGDGALGGGNIRSPFEKIGWNPHRDRGRTCHRAASRKGEYRGRLARQ